MRIVIFIVTILYSASMSFAQQKWTWTMLNPAKFAYTDEVVRVGPQIDASEVQSGASQVLQDGKSVPFDLWMYEGKLRAWVMTTVEQGKSHSFELRPGKPAAATGLIRIEKADGQITLSNGRIAIKIPDSGTPTEIPSPITAFSIGGGEWRGRGSFQTTAKLKSVTTQVGSGNVAGMARVTYSFAPAGEYVVDILLPPQRDHVIIEESFERMPAGSRWVFDVAAGWKPTIARVQLNNEGMGAGAGASFPKDKWPTSLATGQTRMEDRLVNLLPRWSQSFDDGWYFAATDTKTLVGVLPARAGKWVWPHDNKIVVRVKKSADYAGLELPTESGARYWLLIAGDASLAGQERDLAIRHTMANLDKVANDYICTWPGVTKGAFEPVFFFDNATNPTGQRRQEGKAALRDAGNPGDLSTLFAAQQSMDPDWYGSYGIFWSPENPNFFTDFHKVTLGLTARLRSHPQFELFRARAEAIVRQDLDHSVTLPGGAGQECPGYQLHAAEQWLAIADVCKKYLKFDPTQWPRYKATGSFIAHLSQPIGNGQRAFHPGGDTHPGRPDPIQTATKFGFTTDPKSLVTEELPGFGVVFRNSSGSPEETYLAFKSGPNRGHYHGDQLSFHYCANAKPLAVDHHCSYKPRAGQEHMHNRLAFSTDKLPFANMDGYERLIAFKSGKDADIAVGQVESDQLRITTEYPPENWDAREPTQTFAKPLVYRRTIVMLKGKPDVFVIRDQYWGPSVNVSFMLHVLGDRAVRSGDWIECDGLSLFVASPKVFDFKPFTWQHENGGSEKTTGPRLTVTGDAVEFITVMTPGKKRDDIAVIEQGVQIGDTRVTFPNTIGPVSTDQRVQTHQEVRVERDGQPLADLKSSDISFTRSQGDIGLFVPDAGYPFGPIPQWLREQRSGRYPSIK